jgi:hypothetical protein
VIRDRYPDADVLAQRGHWDDATRQVVLDRVYNVPPFRHFAPAQQATLIALCDRVIPQLHRPAHKRVPIAPWIDQHCHLVAPDGYRYEDMPANAVAWEWGLEGLGQTAQALFGSDFAALGPAGQDAVLEAVRRGEPPGEVWQRMPAKRWWINTALSQITGVYYAHPYAWDEIGYGGPSYPRGYFALNNGAPEPWEPREVPAEKPERAEKAEKKVRR